MSRDELVRWAWRSARHLDESGNTVTAGLLRALVRELVAPEGEAGTCACGCGERLVQPRTGRRRRWVDESHRNRARRR